MSEIIWNIGSGDRKLIIGDQPVSVNNSLVFDLFGANSQHALSNIDLDTAERIIDALSRAFNLGPYSTDDGLYLTPLGEEMLDDIESNKSVTINIYLGRP